MALETILLALGPNDNDRADALVDFVSDIAGPANATVALAHVYTEDEFREAATRLEFADHQDATAIEVAKRLSVIRDIGDELDDAGIDFHVTSQIGEHGESIVDLSTVEDADLVVVGGRKRSPTGKAIFGSTAQQVMLESTTPVTFVRGD
ncbi:universal stress protein [Halorubrum sp. CSM-61]|uniref:universal stress protein n=1 Tax=Halorubrum sp. CSM-61 TaxID=2485838 RepID=UPI000F4B7AE1|nr:universal stress protein [Halorubrum sp. CSM-61]